MFVEIVLLALSASLSLASPRLHSHLLACYAHSTHHRPLNKPNNNKNNNKWGSARCFISRMAAAYQHLQPRLLSPPLASPCPCPDSASKWIQLGTHNSRLNSFHAQHAREGWRGGSEGTTKTGEGEGFPRIFRPLPLAKSAGWPIGFTVWSHSLSLTLSLALFCFFLLFLFVLFAANSH